MLIEGEEKLRSRGIALWLAALNPDALAMVEQSDPADKSGRQGIFFNLQVAVDRYAQIDA